MQLPSKQWNRLKVVVVGPENVGKTHLIHCLQKRDYPKNISTDGTFPTLTLMLTFTLTPVPPTLAHSILVISQPSLWPDPRYWPLLQFYNSVTLTLTLTRVLTLTLHMRAHLMALWHRH